MGKICSWRRRKHLFVCLFGIGPGKIDKCEDRFVSETGTVEKICEDVMYMRSDSPMVIRHEVMYGKICNCG